MYARENRDEVGRVASESLRLVAQLSRSSQPFQALVELTADAIFCYEYDPPISASLPVDEQLEQIYDGVLVDCNVACARTYGALDRDEVIGKRLSELFPKTDDSHDALYRAFIENGYKTIEGESIEVLPDGGRRVYLNNAIGVLADGFLLRIWGTWRDVTAQRAAHDALRDSESRTRALMEANPDLVFRVDHEGRYLDFHAGDESLLAVSPRDFIGRKASEFFDEDFVRESDERIKAALATGAMQLWRYELPLQDTRREFEARFVPSGSTEVVVTIRDVTDQAELEREIIASSERERSLIGHDLHDGLGQTLTGISLGLKTLAKKLSERGSPEVEYLEHLTALVQSAITETRRVARLLSPEIAERGLANALSSLAETINGYPGVNCVARCSTAGDVPAVLATHLYRIAQESINNALRHGRARNIELHFESDADRARLEILDDGDGIPPAQERTDGMGLRSMRYRARIIRGEFEIESRTGGGTRVLCTCPL